MIYYRKQLCRLCHLHAYRTYDDVPKEIWVSQKTWYFQNTLILSIETKTFISTDPSQLINSLTALQRVSTDGQKTIQRTTIIWCIVWPQVVQL